MLWSVLGIVIWVMSGVVVIEVRVIEVVRMMCIEGFLLVYVMLVELWVGVKWGYVNVVF